MKYNTCSLWILVARSDLSFMMHTIPHLVKMNNFPFEEKVLAIDTAPLTGDKINRPGVGTLEELSACTQQLLKKGIVDRVVEINYHPEYRDRLYRLHFATPLKPTHNYKGYPILGTIFTIEECKSDYLLHFDSDMLMYQNPLFNWVKLGMELMAKHPEIMFVRPLTGPPTDDGTLYQSKYEKDPDGFYKFKFFSSRVYLINRQSFAKLLPLPIIWRSSRRKWVNNLPLTWKNTLNYFTGKGALDSWEIMVSKKLETTKYVRGVLADPNAWTIHPQHRSRQFITALPRIIEQIEAGIYPPQQAGHYDLKLELWLMVDG
ncbi:MAG: hypothetical protein DSM107014_14845 [Gomphosphaeria aponina SAG 52.96 = DSM 107014]|uniref:Nucleotide-diphospho-sugar transferase domain-containing protein n=1 Tax=Gomphosphaeria aponina SAG 52.96 = DSM 107014 TaxID=1521640 RepID=A0A941JVJ4_9CHRO|nr:hypothetical protein [Gomphosphaeria aponina SAG 52.96 = DSM 107014]